MEQFTENHPGVARNVPPATRGFRLNHSMLRVKDPEISLAFYTRVLGMGVQADLLASLGR